MLFRVDNSELLPHLSLFHLKVSTGTRESLEKELDTIASKQKSISLSIEKTTRGINWFSIDTDSPCELLTLHRVVVEKLKDYRSGQMPWPVPIKSALEKSYQKKYGAPNVLKRFSPHFTLGWTKHEGDLDRVILGLKKLKLGTLTLNRLAITQVDKHCQVHRVLKEYRLQH